MWQLLIFKALQLQTSEGISLQWKCQMLKTLGNRMLKSKFTNPKSHLIKMSSHRCRQVIWLLKLILFLRMLSKWRKRLYRWLAFASWWIQMTMVEYGMNQQTKLWEIAKIWKASKNYRQMTSSLLNTSWTSLWFWLLTIKSCQR